MKMTKKQVKKQIKQLEKKNPEIFNNKNYKKLKKENPEIATRLNIIIGIAIIISIAKKLAEMDERKKLIHS